MATDENDQQKAPSHLLVFYIVTAGKNGEKLGADEEQIVVLNYLLYDVANRKVVCVQPCVVKPSGGVDEVWDGALTEDCRAETGLSDEDLLRGKPLHMALNELDQMLVTKGIHPDHNGSHITLVTDGQLHLRLGLHAEASKKRLPLQSYLYSFCDLRKEVQKFFKTGSVKNLEDMMYYLMLEGVGRGTGIEYGVNKCQDMVTVIACLIDAGCKFNTPEIITKSFDPVIYMSSDHIDDDRVVKCRGLPWQASDHDIARFFSGLNVSRGGVAVCLSKNGRRNGEALIYFENAQQRELALRKHKHHIGSRYVELYPGTGKEFIQIAGCASARVYNFLCKRGVSTNHCIIRMRGLPFSTKTAEIKEFFMSGKHGVEILGGDEGVLYVYHPDGRPTGDAFVLLNSDADTTKALKKHCKESIGSRYIELYKSTPVEVTQVINKCADVENMKKENSDKKQHHHGDRLPLALPPNGAIPTVSSAGGLLPGFVHAIPPPSPVTPPFPPSLGQPPPPMPLQPLTNLNNLPLQPLKTNAMPHKTINNNFLGPVKVEGRKDCLHVQHLPLEATMANILAFLDDLARKATSVHIMYDMHGLPRGEAIVQMDSSESAKLAEIQTSGKQIIFNHKSYVLEAAQISKEEMFSKAVSPATPSPPALTPPTQGLFPQMQPLAQQQNVSLGGGQIMYHQIMQQVAIGGPSQAYQMALPMWYPGAAGVPTSTASPLAAAAIQQAQQAALLQQIQQQQFSTAALSPLGQQPGILPQPKIANPTTVVVKGLPQGVSSSNIRAFFKGIYESLPDIQIVIGPDGKPAGEVRVTFGSRPEAERAIIECNQKMIGNRAIELHMA